MEAEHQAGSTPPVFIVVCNNTSVSKLVFDWIAGWERQIGNDDETVAVKGALPCSPTSTRRQLARAPEQHRR